MESGLVRNVLGFGGVFNLHIVEFFGIKDLATLQTLNKLSVFVPRDDSNLGMSAGGSHRSSFFSRNKAFLLQIYRRFERHRTAAERADAPGQFRNGAKVKAL